MNVRQVPNPIGLGEFVSAARLIAPQVDHDAMSQGVHVTHVVAVGGARCGNWCKVETRSFTSLTRRSG